MSGEKHRGGWVLKSSPSCGALKRSSSVEILVGTEPSQSRLVSTNPSTSGHVKQHKMNGSGGLSQVSPFAEGKVLSPASPPPNGSDLPECERQMPCGSNNFSVSNISLPTGADSNVYKINNTAVNTNGSTDAIVPSKLTDHKPSDEIPLNPVNLVSNSVPNPDPFSPDNLLHRLPGEVLNPQLSPRLREKSQMLPRVALAKKADPSSPLGTPVIGSRGHVFCVSTPEVDPDPIRQTKPPPPKATGDAKTIPLLPKPPEDSKTIPPPSKPSEDKKKTSPLPKPPEDKTILPPSKPLGDKMAVAQCVGDPFTQRRKITPPTEPEDEEESGPGKEAVWQRRLSQLFVPPTDTELDGDKEPEETSQLLPHSSPKPLVIKVTPASPFVGRTRERGQRRGVKEKRGDNREKRRDSEERGDSKDNWEEKRTDSREEIKDTKERIDNKESRDSKESRLKDSEERKKQQTDFLKPRQSRIFFLDEKNKKEEEGDDVDDILHFGRWGRVGDESRSSSSVETSEEEEGGVDDYTSWDDTICSNRSAYFKMYYSQRGIIGGGRGEDKDSNKLKASLASSHNSLSSLIKERMGKPSGPGDKKKTRGDLGLMVLVGVLFVIIVVGISLTTYFYNLHLLELSIFNRIKFYETPRHLTIYSPAWEEMMTAHLGSNLPAHSIPEDCTHYLHYLHQHNYSLPHAHHQHLDEDLENAEMICLDWTGLAQLQLWKHPSQGDVQCYSVWWIGLAEHFTLKDCLLMGQKHGTWWGGGEMTAGGYPLTNANIPLTRMVTGKLGRDPWGQLLRHTWLSNTSALLKLPEDFHGDVSVNEHSDNQVCLEARPNPTNEPQSATMRYSLCVASNLTSLIQHLHQEAVHKRKIVTESAKSLVQHVFHHVNGSMLTDGKQGHGVLREVFNEEVVVRVKERLKHPVWIPWMTPDDPELTQDAVVAYVQNILNQKYGLWGHILLPATWQAQPGDLEFDPKRFPDPTSLVQTLEKKGFRLALTIHPFVSVEASAFNAGTQEGLWVRQKDSNLPALATFDERHPTVVTDFSNPRAKQWFSSQLNHINLTYSVNRFHLQPADAHALPVFHEYHMNLPGPDSALIHFMAAVSSVSPPISTEGTVTPPLPPTFLSLGTGDGSWAGLETLIPRVLTLATLGYPLVDIGPVGGLARAGHVPERELYIRWLEASTFLPAIQISVLPDIYDEEVVKLAREYARIRETMVLPRYNDMVPAAITEGTPLVTPLALFAPGDPEAAEVDDEWMVGKDLLVAPITHRRERSRDVYLPDGIWKDEIDGHLRRGGRWIRNYKVPLTKTPHFTLKPIDEFSP